MTSVRRTRRQLLATASMATASAATTSIAGASGAGPAGQDNSVPEDFRIRNRRIHQSVMGWCFNPLPTPELIRHCADIGLEAIEGIPPNFYPAALQQGLRISLVSSHGFAVGPVDRDHHDVCIQKLRSSIDLAVQNNCSRVITFTGMRVAGMSDQTAEQNCLDCWKQVIAYAEQNNVTLVLEHLNSRDDTHPMKGHPGYFGDDLDRCIELIRRMDSPNFKLLFDIYHVQVMHGDVIRRIRDQHALIGHYHTAGNPGRGELDEHQEINYPAIMRAILQTGYQGFVAQEFIPTWQDPIAALRHAAMVCDV